MRALRANGLRGARIGIPRAFYYDRVTPPGDPEPRGGLNVPQMALMADAIAVLKQQGAIVIDPANIPSVVDADPGSNPANWQWVAGSGADAAPNFRVFNPTLQGEKFDPDGVYVRRWVPELTLLPAGLIHQPWMATPLELAGAGVELGKTFPYPIVDRRTVRERALAAYAGIRNASMTSV